MAFVGIKQIGQQKLQFHADGSVTKVNASGSSVSAPQKSAPQQVVEQVVEKAKEMVEAMKPAPEVVPEKQKTRRGRKPKSSAE